MYRILNPMNHNVSLVRNGDGEELVVIGKGIAFGKNCFGNRLSVFNACAFSRETE